LVADNEGITGRVCGTRRQQAILGCTGSAFYPNARCAGAILLINAKASRIVRFAGNCLQKHYIGSKIEVGPCRTDGAIPRKGGHQAMSSRQRPRDRPPRADFSAGWLSLVVALLILFAAFALSDDLEVPAIAAVILVPAIMLVCEIRRRRAVWERWQSQQKHRSRSGERTRANTAVTINKQSQPWWEVLGISEQSTAEDVKAAYYGKIKQFHPDTVTGLAKEFQELAERKTKEINHAYRQACQACQGYQLTSPHEPQENQTGR
jgi:hypothetical protein